MKDDSLGPRARALLDAAAKAEPGLDDETRARMRAHVVGVLGATAVVTTAQAATAAAAKVATTVAGPQAAGGAAGGAVGATTMGALLKAGTALTLVVATTSVGIGLVGASAQEDRAGNVPVDTSPRLPTPKAAALPTSADPVTPDAPPARGERAIPNPVSSPPMPTASNDTLPTTVSTAVRAPTGSTSMPTSARTPTVGVRSRGTVAAGLVRPVPSSSGEDPRAAFERELQTIDRARGAEAVGDHARALAVLERAGASTVFAEESAALRIVALCGSGQGSEGLRELGRFRLEFPRSLQIERAERACVTDPLSGGHSRK